MLIPPTPDSLQRMCVCLEPGSYVKSCRRKTSLTELTDSQRKENQASLPRISSLKQVQKKDQPNWGLGGVENDPGSQKTAWDDLCCLQQIFAIERRVLELILPAP